MAGEPVHKEHVAALHLGGDDPVLRQVLGLDEEADARALAVVQESVAMAAGDDFDTAVLAEGVGQRHPHGEHIGLVGFR